MDVLGELPLVQGVSSAGDQGVPYALAVDDKMNAQDGAGGAEWKRTMESVGGKVRNLLSLN